MPHSENENVKSRTDDTAQVTTLARVALSEVLVDLRRGRQTEVDVTDAIRRACDAARTQGLHVEDLLIIVKKAWQELSDSPLPERRFADTLARYDIRSRRDETLDEVVSACIKEFYQTGETPTDSQHHGPADAPDIV